MAICVLGSANLDTVLRVDALPRPGETVPALDVSDHLGGKGANQAAAAARMGARTAFLGATGADAAGDWLRERLFETGVDVSGLGKLTDQPSGRAYITLSRSGENAIVVVGGANLAFSPDRLPYDALASYSVFLSQLETPMSAIAALFSHPRAGGGVRILNAAPALPEGRALFPLADVIVVNEIELMAYAGLHNVEAVATDLERAARSLIQRQDQAVVVTLGQAGAAVVRSQSFDHAPGCAVQPLDTTGAGDCFCGVLAAELDRGAELVAAAGFANAAAALSVTRLGAAASAPTRAEVDAFLAGR
jgi:ribokinase